MAGILWSLLLLLCITMGGGSIHAKNEDQSKDPYQKKMELFQTMETMTGIPWYYLASIDQYEKNIRSRNKEKKNESQLLSIHIPPDKWAGPLNPNGQDTSPLAIQWFNGMGSDGNGDHVADPTDDADVIFTLASYLSQFGFTEEDIRIGLWEYYRNDKAVQLISNFSKIYRYHQTLRLDQHAFPLPIYANYSYRSTWGAARGWGGKRMHEGTDLFANYGTPVKSVAHGIIEVKGWNRFGGWRIGIRDLNNVYHYYAHLGGFNKKLNIGDVVKPGDVVGWVGSSGYGKPGTSGKFPPHLHYGMYKYNGKTEWAFDPYPHLKKWERQEQKKKK